MQHNIKPRAVDAVNISCHSCFRFPFFKFNPPAKIQPPKRLPLVSPPTTEPGLESQKRGGQAGVECPLDVQSEIEWNWCTLLETKISLENWWLEVGRWFISFRDGLFSGATLLASRGYPGILGSSPLRQFSRLMLITRYGAGKAEVSLVWLWGFRGAFGNVGS